MSQKPLATVAAAGSLKRPHVMLQSAVGAQALVFMATTVLPKALCAAPLMSQWMCLCLSPLSSAGLTPAPTDTVLASSAGWGQSG